MSADTAPAFPVRYADTQTGRASLWVRGFACPPPELDFQDALESLRCRKAAQRMREEEQ